jgi:hypothetical protein
VSFGATVNRRCSSIFSLASTAESGEESGLRQERASMSDPNTGAPETRDPVTGRRIWTVGTLKYTTFGLMMVFIWLLWGDFVWSLLDGHLPDILPLKLKELGAGDTLNVVINKTRRR